MSALASATTDSSGVSSGGNTMSTSTEAIIAAATSAEAAAAVVQEQGATLVTVHPAVIEAPVDVTEGQGNEGDENEGDGMTNHFICFAVSVVSSPISKISDSPEMVESARPFPYLLQCHRNVVQIIS